MSSGMSPRLGLPFVVVLTGARVVRITEGVDERTQFLDGLSGGGFDGLERFSGLVGILLETAAGGCGVNSDAGDVVGDTIVELASDAHSFEVESLTRSAGVPVRGPRRWRSGVRR